MWKYMNHICTYRWMTPTLCYKEASGEIIPFISFKNKKSVIHCLGINKNIAKSSFTKRQGNVNTKFYHGYLEDGGRWTELEKSTWGIQCVANILFLKLGGKYMGVGLLLFFILCTYAINILLHVFKNMLKESE